MAGAPVGNQNAAKAKVWAAAIHRALAERTKLRQKEAIDELAGVLLDKAQEGDLMALKELGDRLDGKAHQSTDIDLRGSLTKTLEDLPVVGARANPPLA